MFIEQNINEQVSQLIISNTSVESKPKTPIIVKIITNKVPVQRTTVRKSPAKRAPVRNSPARRAVIRRFQLAISHPQLPVLPRGSTSIDNLDYEAARRLIYFYKSVNQPLFKKPESDEE